MKCNRGVMVVLPIGTCLVILASIAFLVSRGGCPEGTFSCANSTLCIPQRGICNGHPDCPFSDDEDGMYCSDVHGGFWELVGNLNYQAPNQSCVLDHVPLGCRCTDFTVVICKNSHYTELPTDLSENTTRLIFTNNTRNLSLDSSSFEKFNLKFIHLGSNRLQNLPDELFDEQHKLARLFLTNNNLDKISDRLFQNLRQLKWLFLNDNKLVKLNIHSWHLPSLYWLELSKNQITLECESFPKMLTLSLLYLEWNNINEIKFDTFRQLENLKDLSLKGNKISSVHPLSFEKNTLLQELDLSYNQIQKLSEKLFKWNRNLEKLALGNNKLLIIEKALLEPLVLLRSLDLENIELTNIDVSMFTMLPHLDFIYFKKFYYCTYAPKVPKCTPTSNGISSLDDLLADDVIRWTLWMVACFTIAANAMVLVQRIGSLAKSTSPLSVVVTNLAVADLLMGIYLVVIGWEDFQYRGVYKMYAHRWMSSSTCTAAGVIAMLSSEVSVLILLLISAERFLLIATPFSGNESLSSQAALKSVFLIWGFGLAVALVPVVHWRSAMRFYGTNSLCFPLHIDDPYLVGWEFSAFVFIGINSLGMLGIAVLYAGVFYGIWKTRHATTLNVSDSEFAMRFFCIVLTNACCWVPIIILKVLAFFRYHFTGELYAWIAVFVLPINSAVNPILYTFSTPTYKNVMRKLQLHIGRKTSHDVEISRSSSNRNRVWFSRLPLTRKQAHSDSNQRTAEDCL